MRLTPALGFIVASTVAAPAARAQTPPPYSLPWQLRPVRPANVVRLENVVATSDDPTGASAVTDVAILTASHKVGSHLTPLLRAGLVVDAPDEGDTRVGFTNILLGATWAVPAGDGFVVTPFLGVTLPVGSGGGNDPDLDALAANRAGVLARSAMDNALFSVNDLTIIPGVGAAWVKRGFTVQVEATLLQLMRVRGDEVQADEQKTNFTTGVHVGWFATPALSLGAELRYQTFLSTPAAIRDDPTDTLRDNLSIAAGVRVHLKLDGKTWLRPGIAYARGLDDPMSARSYHILHLDVPFAF